MLSRRLARILCAAALACAGPLHADALAPSTLALLRDLQPLSDDFARYRYLIGALPRLPRDQRDVARQMLSSAESELGLYTEALRDFPRRVPTDIRLSPDDWSPTDAVEAIAGMARGQQLVLINEAHHDPRTRVLTLALLPRLRKEGFTHFALEALGDEDPQLAARGYPLLASGSEYLHEPVYGEIVREALRLGFVLVPYEVNVRTVGEREAGQAGNLYRKVFAASPGARLFVHAGFAHIDKAKGSFGDIEPMAAQLARLSGIRPLSIDQAQFREASPLAVAGPSPSRAYVLARRTPARGGDEGAFWSATPRLHDVSVILPPLSAADAPAEDARPPDGRRPAWLDLHGQRLPLAVNGASCRGSLPCLVEAFHADETGAVVAADRYVLARGDTGSQLYLFPGRYRLRTRDAAGKVLQEWTATVQAPQVSRSHAARASAKP